MNEETRKKILHRLRNSITNPYKQAENFLAYPWVDGSSDSEIIETLEREAVERPRSLLTGIQAIELLLAEPDNYDLVALVGWGANQSLDDPQKDSIPWLRNTVDMIKDILRKQGHQI